MLEAAVDRVYPKKTTGYADLSVGQAMSVSEMNKLTLPAPFLHHLYPV